MPKKDVPVDRLPTNQLSSIWINVMGWLLYLIPVFFPHLVWLGLAPILMGFPMQFVAHAILTNIRLKTFYNPGVVAVVFGHTPLAIWYIAVVYQEGLIHWWDWIFGVLLLAAFTVVVFQRIGFGIVAPRGADRYYYPAADYNRWDRVRRLTRAGITPRPIASDTTA